MPWVEFELWNCKFRELEFEFDYSYLRVKLEHVICKLGSTPLQPEAQEFQLRVFSEKYFDKEESN